MNEYQENLERVAKAAKTIFDVTTVSGVRTKRIECPHGNIPSYPTHAWWCDECFWELEEALQDLESFQQSVQLTGGTLCGLEALSQPEDLSGLEAESTPPTSN